MAELVPLLQIVHVSDLHECTNYSDKAHLAVKGRAMRLWVRKKLEKHNIKGWHEGTLPHDDRAAAAFERFLQRWVGSDPVWFPADRKNGPPTWLVHTGDATTFGDLPSLERVQDRFQRWRQILACEALSLFGNHDAWPGTQPVLLAGPDYGKRIQAQRALLDRWKEWDKRQWMNPLRTASAGGLPRIELYGLNSVSFGLWDNLRAVGRISGEDLDAFGHVIEAQGEGPVYRILATHHPIAFPFERDEVNEGSLAEVMLLHGHRRVAERLKNDPPVTGSKCSPYVHLLLSGHTHLGYPAAMPDTVKESQQGVLARNQLQLVAGSLMLVRSDPVVLAGRAPHVLIKYPPDFTHPTVFDANQQFEILRLSFDSDTPDGLVLERILMARTDNSPDGYVPIEELFTSTFALLDP